MTGSEAPLWAELRDPALRPVWAVVRRQLETTGLTTTSTVTVLLDAVAADLLGGLLGRRLLPGQRKLSLSDLDTALRSSPAAASLVDVMTELGGALRNRPAERQAAADRRRGAEDSWASLLVTAGLTDELWVSRWTADLRANGLLSAASSDSFGPAVTAVELVLRAPVARTLGELAALVAGDAHGLDAGRRAGTIALRGLAAEHGEAPPATADDRARLWARSGVRTDDVSGTVLVLGLRPRGTSRWAGQIRERADLGLVTHLTLRELRMADCSAAEAGSVVFACENPQVVQAAADRLVPGPLVCLQGNPSAAGALLLARLVDDRARVRYHGDFDWPGLAIAGRVLGRGATPWRLTADDYLTSLPSGPGVPLTGQEVATPWHPPLQTAMREDGRAVHEEAVLDGLIADLLDSPQSRAAT